MSDGHCDEVSRAAIVSGNVACGGAYIMRSIIKFRVATHFLVFIGTDNCLNFSGPSRCLNLSTEVLGPRFLRQNVLAAYQKYDGKY